MACPAQDITDAELEILKFLWSHGPAPIRLITDHLYEEGTPAQYATVQKLLERLEAKELVRRERVGRANVYSAAVERQHVIARRLRKLADKLCEGSLSPLLTHLVDSVSLTADEREQLHELLESHNSATKDTEDTDARRQRSRGGSQ